MLLVSAVNEHFCGNPLQTLSPPLEHTVDITQQTSIEGGCEGIVMSVIMGGWLLCMLCTCLLFHVLAKRHFALLKEKATRRLGDWNGSLKLPAVEMVVSAGQTAGL